MRLRNSKTYAWELIQNLFVLLDTTPFWWLEMTETLPNKDDDMLGGLEASIE